MIVESPHSIVTALLLDDGTIEWQLSDKRTAELLVDPRVRLGAMLFYGSRHDNEFHHSRNPVFVNDDIAYHTNMEDIRPKTSETEWYLRPGPKWKITITDRIADIDLAIMRKAQQTIGLWIERM